MIDTNGTLLMLFQEHFQYRNAYYGRQNKVKMDLFEQKNGKKFNEIQKKCFDIRFKFYEHVENADIMFGYEIKKQKNENGSEKLFLKEGMNEDDFRTEMSDYLNLPCIIKF